MPRGVTKIVVGLGVWKKIRFLCQKRGPNLYHEGWGRNQVEEKRQRDVPERKRRIHSHREMSTMITQGAPGKRELGL